VSRKGKLLAILFAAGCSSSAVKLVDRAVLQAVSGDQNWVAYFTGTEGQSGTVVGNLSVLDRGAQASRPLAAGAFNVSFSDGDVLSYTTNLTVADDNGGRALYGPLSVWAPSLSAPVVINQGLSVLDAMSADRSAIVSFDAPLPHRTPQQTGNVFLARAPDWTPMQIASGQLTTLNISSDGRFAAWVIYVPGATTTDDRWQSWLYSIGDGRTSMLGSSVSTNLVSFSPNGERIATANGSLALEVLATATATPLGWTGPTAGLLLAQAAFSDDNTLVVRMRASGTQTLWRTTELQATMLGQARDFLVQRTPDGAGRFVFASTMASSSATQDLVLYDLAQAQPQPQMLSTTSNGPSGVTISDDLTRARYLDAYDPNQAAGALTIVDLSTSKSQAVAPNIQAGGSQFLTGGATLYWLDNLGGNGTLWSWDGGANLQRAQSCYNFRTRAPSLFVTLTAPDPQSGASGPGIWQLH
jgi:hypothetical protein